MPLANLWYPAEPEGLAQAVGAAAFPRCPLLGGQCSGVPPVRRLGFRRPGAFARSAALCPLSSTPQACLSTSPSVISLLHPPPLCPLHLLHLPSSLPRSWCLSLLPFSSSFSSSPSSPSSLWSLEIKSLGKDPQTQQEGTHLQKLWTAGLSPTLRQRWPHTKDWVAQVEGNRESQQVQNRALPHSRRGLKLLPTSDPSELSPPDH